MVKAAIRAEPEQNPHAALRAEVSNAQFPDFAKLCERAFPALYAINVEGPVRVVEMGTADI